MSDVRLMLGDCLDVMRTIPDGSVHCCVTSPPYFGLRDYGTARWEGGDPACDHRESKTSRTDASVASSGLEGGKSHVHMSHVFRDECGRCGARRADGQIGLEKTPEDYVARMVDVFREVRRVLRDDGTLFLNLGDSYFGSTQTGGTKSKEGSPKRAGRMFSRPSPSRRATACDTSGKAPGDSPASDCLCGSLCDACRVAYQIGRSHSDGRPAPTPSPSPCGSIPEHTVSPSDRHPTSDSSPRAGRNGVAIPDPGLSSSREVGPPLVSLGSTTYGSSPQRPGDCHPSDQPSGCRLCGRSLVDCAQSSAHRTACTCGIGTLLDASGRRTSGRSSSDLAYPHFSTTSLKEKDLIGIPWRVAFALQADGWYLRSDIIWHKPNPMPESVRDRPTKSHEYLFLLSKSATYFYDADAIKEPNSPTGKPWGNKRLATVDHDGRSNSANTGGINREGKDPGAYWGQGRNRRSVWSVATRPFKGAHFATFPPKLIEPCILAGTSEVGCCPACGKPWERVVERGELVPTRKHHDKRPYGVVRENADKNDQGSNRARDGHRANMAYERHTLGFRPACPCDAGDPVPCAVLDPFSGAFTTGVVAKQHGRSFLGIELNPAYLEMGRERLAKAQPPLPGVFVPRPTFEASA